MDPIKLKSSAGSVLLLLLLIGSLTHFGDNFLAIQPSVSDNQKYQNIRTTNSNSRPVYDTTGLNGRALIAPLMMNANQQIDKWKNETSPLSPEDFHASGSSQTTRGSIASGSTSLALISAIDFNDGNGIRINKVGATFRINQPTNLSIVTHGPTGSAKYCYRIASMDGHGGIGVATSEVCITNGVMILSSSAYNLIRWSPPSSGTIPSLYAVYGRAFGSEVLLGITPTTSFFDFGDSITNFPFSIDWLPPTPLSFAQNDYLVTRIGSGGGTKSLTLMNSALNSESSVTVSHDDTEALQTMINALEIEGGGYAELGPTTYYVTSPLSISSSHIFLYGRGQAFSGQLGVNPASSITAMGGGKNADIPNGIINIGAFGNGSNNTIGGGLRNLALNGQAMIAQGIYIKDHQDGRFTDISVTGAAIDGIKITNTSSFLNPTRDEVFDHLNVHEWNTSTDYANCFTIDGANPGNGASGVTLLKFIYPVCDHSFGSMFNVGAIGDAMTLIRPYEFSPSWFSGYSINWNSIASFQSNGTWQVQQPVFIRPIFVASALGAIGSFAYDLIDTPDTQSTRFTAVVGPGAINVAVHSSTNGQKYGQEKTLGLQTITHHDRGQVIAWNAPILQTADGAYYGSGTTLKGGYIGTADFPGGGILLSAPAVADHDVWIADSVPKGTNFPNGIPLSWNPSLVVTTNTLGLSNADSRFGFICDTNDPPMNGVYIEASSSSTDYQLVVANRGKYSRADMGFALSNAPWQYRLDILYGSAAIASARQINRTQYSSPVSILNSSQAIPDANCPYMAWIKSTNGASQTLLQLDQKIGYQRP